MISDAARCKEIGFQRFADGPPKPPRNYSHQIIFSRDYSRITFKIVAPFLQARVVSLEKF
jgi:hypothetical protein